MSTLASTRRKTADFTARPQAITITETGSAARPSSGWRTGKARDPRTVERGGHPGQHRKALHRLMGRLVNPIVDAPGARGAPARESADYAAWITQLAVGDQVAIENSRRELTGVARVTGIARNRIELDGVPVSFWTIDPFIGRATEVRLPDEDGAVRYQRIRRLSAEHRLWLEAEACR